MMQATARMTKTARKKHRRAERPEPAPMDGDSELRLAAALRNICCSESWIDSIMVEMRKPLAKRKFHYVTDPRGRVLTSMSDLLIEIELAGFYPPPADDRPARRTYLDGPRRYRRRVTAHHPGSQMVPCLSEKCTGEHNGGLLSVMYPPTYLRCGAICETCHQNGTDLDERAAELGFDQSAVGMSPTSVGFAAMRYYGLRVKHQKTKLGKRRQNPRSDAARAET